MLKAEQYLQPEVIQQINRLDLRARFIVEGFINGLHRSPFHGFSVEFSEHRKYTPGDDIRLVDWNVYGKTDRYYIKKFEAETNMEAYLLVDCSGSMDFSTGQRLTKMEYGICIAAAIGHMMIRQQDPVGLFTFDEKIITGLPPKCKPAHLTQILTILSATRPFGRTGLASCLHNIASRIKKKSMIILISDLLDDQEEVINAIRHIRHDGHDLIIFQILDYNELRFEYSGRMQVEDIETAGRVVTDGQSVRENYLREINNFIQRYQQVCQQTRADLVTIDNSMTFDKALMKFLLQRHKI